jgi:hypothetical protein
MARFLVFTRCKWPGQPDPEQHLSATRKCCLRREDTFGVRLLKFVPEVSGVRKTQVEAFGTEADTQGLAGV